MKPQIRRPAIAALLLMLAPLAQAAPNYGFDPPPTVDDARTAAVMRDLAERIVPVYQETNTDTYLANLTALQLVTGACSAAYDTSKVLRDREQGQPPGRQLERAIADGIYAHACEIESTEHLPFAQAFARAFREIVPKLDNIEAGAVIAHLQAPAAEYADAVQKTFDRWRSAGSIPEADAVALVRSYLGYQAHRAFGPLITALDAEEDARRYIVDADATITTAAGVVIHAVVVRPSGNKPMPALLRFTLDPDENDAKQSAIHGYVGITAYARGRLADGSGAVWPFRHDGDDARAVVDWIAEQPWSNGEVGMFGEAYSGYTAWSAAARRPPALKAIATSAPMAPGINFPMAGQIFHNSMVRWTQQHTLDQPAPVYPNEDAKWLALNQIWYASGRPYWDLDHIFLGERSRLLRTWLTHPSDDRYWQKFMPTAKQFAEINIPVLDIAGYYGATAGALYYFHSHRLHRPQADDRLLAGPYDADSIRTGTAATLRGYTLDASARVDLRELRYQWFDHVLKHAPLPPLLQDRINYEVMGADQWRHLPALDAPKRKPLRFYLDTQNSKSGTYPLRAAAAGDDSSVELKVDLADRSDAQTPWPDALIFKQLPTRNGLAFISGALDKDTEIGGGLRGQFDFEPSRQDVDLSVALYLLKADGDYQLLFEPYDFRASYAADRSNRQLLQAGVRQQLAFTAERLTACKLPAGSRLALVLSINKRPDRQINYGTGKAVNAESIVDARTPMHISWYGKSYIELEAR